MARKKKGARPHSDDEAKREAKRARGNGNTGDGAVDTAGNAAKGRKRRKSEVSSDGSASEAANSNPTTAAATTTTSSSAKKSGKDKKNKAKRQKTAESPGAEAVYGGGDDSSDSEAAFPRGRTINFVRPADIRAAKAAANRDFLFGGGGDDDDDATESAADKKKQAKKEKRKAAKAKAKARAKARAAGESSGSGSDSGGVVPVGDGSETSAEFGLRAKRLREGMSVLGVVEKVGPLSMIVALANGLTGRVPVTELSDALTTRLEGAGSESEASGSDNDGGSSSRRSAGSYMESFFSVGDVVPCAVLSVGAENAAGKSRVDLTLNPALVNAGVSGSSLSGGMALVAAVSSREDHGYVLDVGVDGYSAFLSTKDAAKGRKGGYEVGQPIVVVVKKVKARVVHVAVGAAAVAAGEVDDSAPLELSCLKAGMRLSAAVETATDEGLVLKVAGLFTATADALHSGSPLASDLKAIYAGKTNKQRRCSVRILFADSVSKTVGVSLAEHLLAWQAADVESAVAHGEVFEEATVVRAAHSIGLTLSLGDGAAAGFVHISRVSAKRVSANLGRLYRPGKVVRARVIGFSPCDGLAQCTMVDEEIDRELLRYEDAVVGSDVEGTVLSIESFGVLVQLAPGIKALCPTYHLADVPKLRRPEAKYTAGATLKFRVLSVDAPRKKIVLSRKKTLVNSDLPRFFTYEDAVPDTVSHGVITRVLTGGVIVSFYNNVHGFVMLSRLSTEPVEDPSTLFRVGQIVKARVVTCDPANYKMQLSLVLTRPERKASVPRSDSDAFSSVQIGDVMNVSVTSVHDRAVHVQSTSGVVGFVPRGHMSDHLSVTEALCSASVTPVGSALTVRVLSKDSNSGNVVFTAKRSYVEAPMAEVGKKSKKGKGKGKTASSAGASADEPAVVASFDALSINHYYLGTVKSTTSFGVFVSFLNGMDGLAGLKSLSLGRNRAADTMYTPGQTVIAKVTDLAPGAGTIDLDLRSVRESVSPTALLVSYMDARARVAASKADKLANVPTPGTRVSVTVKVVKDYGAVVDVEGCDLPGFASKNQTKGAFPIPGSKMDGVVLDVDPISEVVDVSLSPEVIESVSAAAAAAATATAKSKKGKKKKDKKGKAAADSGAGSGGLEVGAPVQIRIALAKNDFAIALIANSGSSDDDDDETAGVAGTLVYTSNATFNYRAAKLNKQEGNVMKGVVSAPPASDGSVPAIVSVRPSKGPKPVTEQNLAGIEPGAVVEVKVTAVMPLQLSVQTVETGVKGRVHITQMASDPANATNDVFSAYSVNDTLTVKVLTLTDSTASVKAARSAKHLPLSHGHRAAARKTVEFTLRPDDLALPEGELAPRENDDISSYKRGDVVHGFVQSVSDTDIRVSVSPTVYGRVFATNAANSLVDLVALKSNFTPGMPIKCCVLGVDKSHRQLDLSAKHTDAAELTNAFAPGSVVFGRVSRIGAKSVEVQFGAEVYGSAGLCYLNIHESAMRENPTLAYRVGEFVEAVVVWSDKSHRNLKIAIGTLNGDAANAVRVVPEHAKDLKEGQVVHGYVKATTNKGCFVSLGNRLTARVLITNLSDAFIKDVQAAFPPGKAVRGRVLSVDANHNRVELSLKHSVVSGKVKAKLLWTDVSEGDKLTGTVTKVTDYGVFVRVANSDNISGLVHKSELADAFVKAPGDLYTPSDLVKVAVLSVDAETRKISFGLKPSYFMLDGSSSSSSSSGSGSESEGESGKAKTKKGKKGRVDADGDVDMASASSSASSSASASASDSDEDNDAMSDVAIDTESMQWLPGAGDESSDDDAFMAMVRAEAAKAEGGGGNSGSDSADEEEEEESSADDGKHAGSATATTTTTSTAAKRGKKKRAVGAVGSLLSEPEMEWDGLSKAITAAASARKSREAAAKKKKKNASDSGSSSSSSSSESNSVIDEEDESSDGGAGGSSRSRSKAKRAKLAAKKAAAEAVAKAEADLLDDSRVPDSANDFERRLMGSPRSSYLWIQYMAFHLEATEIESARAVCKRALSAIPLENEQDRLNLWVAWLNLESMHGSADELKAVFVKACNAADPLKVHEQMWKIHNKAGRVDEAASVLKRMTKKFGSENPSVWKDSCRFSLEHGDAAGAKKTLQRALQSLAPREHVNIIAAFAVLEFQVGEPERGRTMLDELLAEYPKRSDVWSVYIDHEISAGNIAGARRLFQRVTSLNLSTKKMKSFITRFVKFEKKHGTPESVAGVVESAREFVDRKLN